MVKTHLLDCFEETVKEKGTATAVRHNDQAISFADLQKKACKMGTLVISKINKAINTLLQSFFPKK